VRKEESETNADLPKVTLQVCESQMLILLSPSVAPQSQGHTAQTKQPKLNKIC